MLSVCLVDCGEVTGLLPKSVFAGVVPLIHDLIKFHVFCEALARTGRLT